MEQVAAAGLFFRFALIGYDFVGYALLFAAAVVAAYHLFGRTLRIVLSVLLAAGVTYFINDKKIDEANEKVISFVKSNGISA